METEDGTWPVRREMKAPVCIKPPFTSLDLSWLCRDVTNFRLCVHASIFGVSIPPSLRREDTRVPLSAIPL